MIQTREFIHNPNYKQSLCLELLYDFVTKYIYFGGAAGGGKSWVGCEWEAAMCLNYPGVRYFMGREQLSSLKDSTVKTFFKMANYHGISDQFRYYEHYSSIRFHNGSEIALLNLQFLPGDPLFERFGSTEYTGGLIEECGQIHFNAFDTLKSRVGRHLNEQYNIPKKVLATGNPKKNWTYHTFYKPWKENRLEDGYAFIQSLATENNKIDKGYLASLDDIKDKILKQRLKYGNFEYEDDPLSLVQYDNIVNIFTNDYVSGGKKYITADIARFGADKTIIRVWDGLRVVERLERTKLKITESAALIKSTANKYQIPMSNVMVDEDGVGCLKKGTKVLTSEGWKKVDDIKPGDLIYSKDEQGNLKLYPAISNDLRETTDVIDLTTGIGFSFSHYLPVASRKEYPPILKSFDKCVEMGKVYTDSKFNWAGHSDSIIFEDTVYEMPNGGLKNVGNKLEVSAINFASFLGWFVSEGCFDDKYIKITQNSDSPDIDHIRQTLRNCGLKIYEKKQSNKRAIDFVFRHKGLKKWLEENSYTSKTFNCYNIRVPEWVRSASREVISSFLDSHNRGDGWRHHGMAVHCTTSVQLSYDLQECMLKCGINANIRISQKAGSTAKIGDRIITRTADCFIVTEMKEERTIGIPSVKEVRQDQVYNLEINSPTRLYLVLFDAKTPFFVHNGGVKDILNCKGFVAASHPLHGANFDMLKSQCGYRLSELINENLIFEAQESPALRESLIEELEQLKRKTDGSDKKQAIMPKEIIKDLIGRSPDDLDTYIMRAWWELQPKKSTGLNLTFSR